MVDGSTETGDYETVSRIEFACSSDYYEEIPHPEPASNYLPDWYKSLDMGRAGGEMTVRDCISFMEAMTIGWVMPCPYDVRISVSENGERVKIDTHGKHDVAHVHSMKQMNREEHPQLPKPIIKFDTPWVITTQDGISVLETQMLNNHDTRYTPFSGIIDTDEYPLHANCPVIWHELGYEGVIEQGEPLFRIIPFTRDGAGSDGVVRSLNQDEIESKKSYREVKESGGTEYRDRMWSPKSASRIVERE